MAARGKQLAVLIWLTGLWAWAAPASAAEWMRAESPHFRVLARSTRSILNDRVQDLERLHHAMLLTLGASPGQGPARPPFEMAMKDDEDFIGEVVPHLRDRAAAGVFTMGPDGAQAFAVVPSMRGRLYAPSKVLMHEYAHRVMAQYARTGYPAWYVEGFACYFGATRMDADGVEIGAADAALLELLNGRWIEPARLLKPGFSSTGQKDIDDSKIDVFYAQAWLLTHYLLSDSGRTQRFNDYFRRVAKGEDALAAFEPATGIALDKLNDELRRHIAHLLAARLPASALPNPVVKFSPLSIDQAQTEMDAMILVASRDAEHGKAILARLRARAKQAGDEQAPDALRWTLAYAEIRHGDPDRALQILAPWARLEDAPFDANRLLGLAWLAEAAKSEGADREQAEEQARMFLMRAYKQRRNHAPTLYWLARVLDAKGPSASLSNAAEAASVLEPGIPEYAHLAAQVHLQAGHPDKAVRPLKMLAHDLHGGLITERARAALQALQSNREPAEALALLNGTQKATSP